MKRHPLDAWSLVFGIAFAALGATFLNTGIDIAHLSGIWLLPLPLLFAGLVLLGFGLSRVRGGAAEAAQGGVNVINEEPPDIPE